MKQLGYANVIQRADQIQLSDKFEYVYDINDLNAEPWIPAIAVPTVEKARFECPQEHIDRLGELLGEVDRILTIGWRGRERHFTSMCAEKLTGNPALTVVGSDPGSAKKIAEYLHGEIPQIAQVKVRVSTANGFSFFLRRDRVEAAWRGDESP